MGFSYKFVCGVVYDQWDMKWKNPIINIPEELLPYLSYESNDLYYFFEDMLNDHKGILHILPEMRDQIPSFDIYFEKTRNHFNDPSDEFKKDCRIKYNSLRRLIIYIITNCDNLWFIQYSF